MEIIEVEAFVAAAREGTLTRAAALLHISQPASTRRIELLERELGVQLFERVPRGVRLTAAGQAFLPYAEAMLLAAREGAQQARAQTGEPSALAIAMPGSLLDGRVIEGLRRFRERYPRVRLLLQTADSDTVSDLVRQGTVQLGFRYFLSETPGLVSEALWEEQLVLVSAAGDVAPPLGSDVKALEECAWVTLDVALLRRNLAFWGIVPRHTLLVDSTDAQRRLIAEGFGVGVLKAATVTADVDEGRLVIIPTPEVQAILPVTAEWRRSLRPDRATQELIGLVRPG